MWQLMNNFLRVICDADTYVPHAFPYTGKIDRTEKRLGEHEKTDDVLFKYGTKRDSNNFLQSFLLPRNSTNTNSSW